MSKPTDSRVFRALLIFNLLVAIAAIVIGAIMAPLLAITLAAIIVALRLFRRIGLQAPTGSRRRQFYLAFINKPEWRDS